MSWYYISFSTETAFLGAAVVEVNAVVVSIQEAVRQAQRLGIDPGGTAMGYKLLEPCPCPPKWRNRLLTRADLEAAGAAPVKADKVFNLAKKRRN